MAEAAVRRARSVWCGFVVLLLFTGGVALTRGPYLQSVTATSAIVVWRTHLPHNNPANTKRCYSFDWGSAHFIALDFNTGLAADQAAWLKDDLAATDRPWKIVFYHQAIYRSSPHGYESWVEAKRQLLAPIFEQNHVPTPVPTPGLEHGAPLFLPAIWKAR